MIAGHRKISAAGKAIIKEHEQLRLVAYLPTKRDVPTIGWGHTKGVKLGMTCTVEQAEKWLESDLFDAEVCINRNVLVPLTQNQFDALVSFAFNVGLSAFRTSTLRKLLNAGDYAGAAAQFPKWKYQKGKELGGLVRRRAAERALFEEPLELEA